MEAKAMYILAKWCIKHYHFIPSEDLVQEMVTVASNASKYYDKSKSNEITYYCKCMKNAGIQQIINEKREKEIPKDKISALDYDIVDNNVNKAKEIHKIYESIYEYLDPLLIEHFINGKSQRVIAKEMNISQQRVSQKINSKIKKLRKILLDLDIYTNYKEDIERLIKGE